VSAQWLGELDRVGKVSVVQGKAGVRGVRAWYFTSLLRVYPRALVAIQRLLTMLETVRGGASVQEC
jgi:hypothetical protein